MQRHNGSRHINLDELGSSLVREHAANQATLLDEDVPTLLLLVVSELAVKSNDCALHRLVEFDMLEGSPPCGSWHLREGGHQLVEVVPLKCHVTRCHCLSCCCHGRRRTIECSGHRACNLFRVGEPQSA